jgi:hypothetical protein
MIGLKSRGVMQKCDFAKVIRRQHRIELWTLAMAMELHVLSNRRLSSIAEWQRAIGAQGFPLRLAADVQFASADGGF